MKKFDVIIIGAGPAGYVCAIKAAQLGFKVACIDKRETLGGTCLNVGCIPSKSLLQSSHTYESVKNQAHEHGVKVSGVEFNIQDMMQRKSKVVTTLNNGIQGLFAKNKVEYIRGSASFKSSSEIIVVNQDSEEVFTAEKFVIATGSMVAQIPGIIIDEESIVSSTGALQLKEVPQKMIVIGGGYIGIEMSSIWARLGSKVTVVEYADRLVATMDSDISKEFKKILEKQGISFKLATKVISANKNKNGVEVTLSDLATQKHETHQVDVVLISVGRKAYTDNLNLDKANIKVDDNGKIKVNSSYQTNVANIFAIGDVIAGPMLAHKAEEEGVAVAEIIAGQHGHVNYDAIPGIVYTHPEVASVGKTEDELKKLGYPYSIGKFPFMANSRARTNGETEGFVKIIADKNTDQIIGAHIIGPNAGELIQQIVVGMEFKAASEDIARICFGHPGLSEAVKEAAMATYSKPIHV